MAKHVTHLLNHYTVLKGGLGQGPDLGAYLWDDRGKIRFGAEGVLETTWGLGTYKWLDAFTVEASWRGISHVLRMNSDYTKFLALRLGDILCIRGAKI
jgi:hypothetical protein